MRSRPTIKVSLSPSPALPGRTLRVGLVVTSLSDTPCDGIEVRLHGTERRYRSTMMGEGVPVTTFDEHTHVALGTRVPSQPLGKGEHRFAIEFELPEGAPPSFLSERTAIEYHLDVRVDIPWWPDRRARYVVPVTVSPVEREVAAPRRAFCSHAGGPQGKELYVELSIDALDVALGGVVTGLVSFANVRWHRVRRVELAFVGVEHSIDPGGSRPVGEHVRFVHTLLEGAPEEGAPIAFRVKLPESATPSFVATYASLDWVLEARAVIALGSDVSLAIPLRVGGMERASDSRTREPVRLLRTAPVGKARRAIVWAEVARRVGLRNDAERERMTLELLAATGPARLEVALEHRGDDGLWSVATVAWPPLGIDVQVGERRWINFGRALQAEDSKFDERFVVRGRERAQVFALLGPDVRRALLAFRSATVDDEGCMLAEPGGAHDVASLQSFVERAVAAARLLCVRSSNVPAPAAFEEHIAAWRAFADRTSARFEVGRPFLHAGTWERETFDLGTRWEGDVPQATIVRFSLPAGVAVPWGESAPAEAKAHLAALARAVTEIDREEGAIVAQVAAPLADPASLAPVLDRMVWLSRALRSELQSET